ncbi:MAG: Arm DNA-binding domain-containing protein [Paracoccaceae bacterium]
MPATNKLSATGLKNLKRGAKVQKITDGGGLFIQVEASRSKLWRLAYRHGGKQRLISLGVYHTVSLAEARAARDAAKTKLAKDLDPSAERQAAKAAAVAETEIEAAEAGKT